MQAVQIVVRVPEELQDEQVKEVRKMIAWELVKGDGLSAEVLREFRLPPLPKDRSDRANWLKVNEGVFEAFRGRIEIVRDPLFLKMVDIEVTAAGRDPFFGRRNRLTVRAQSIRERIKGIAKCEVGFGFTSTEQRKLPERRPVREPHIVRGLAFSR